MKRPTESMVRALIAWILEVDALPTDGPFALVLDEVLKAHREDSARFSDILEFSAQVMQTKATYARFSYAFPGFRDDLNHARLSFLRIAESVGLGEVAARLTRVAMHPAVQQPIVGFAMDDASTPRPKLYLQFHEGASDAARGIAAALLMRDHRDLPAGPLHMLGLDFNAKGALSGAKLYMHTQDAPAYIPQGLARDALDIHRLSGPDAPFALETFDFALVSEAHWPALQASISGLEALHPLEQAFALRVRRASVSTGGRVTAYYVL